MKLIIYGAGATARDACSFIGYSRIMYFAVTNLKQEQMLLKRKVICYEKMLEIYHNSDDCYIVVASDNYYEEMEERNA